MVQHELKGLLLLLLSLKFSPHLLFDVGETKTHSFTRAIDEGKVAESTGQRDLHGYELVGRLSMAQEALPVPLRCSSRRLPRSAVFGFILSFHLNVAELSLTDKNGTLLRDDSRFHTSMATMA